ncbi:activator-dependent family glycosyltransferase [Streptomyces tirandamycinicus]|uniref:activator-dependent family glycosyltransferase n=1 Tax=Streptomyces tirandamycinicus TaxID=2174846 RepID=UPI00226F4D7F|nr:activator-dependent family glycosyltransferase [Streptomyces tirandamycinicus]MCY0979851.1 activator-dependent family glycosyltransferase [Streptomyces tirandamycinicus]
MKVLFTSLAHHTHYYPLVPLAWALRTAGHEVRIASQPELTDVITGTGLTAVPVEWSLGALEDLGLLGTLHDEASAHVQGFDYAARGDHPWTYEQLLALENIMVPTLYGALNNDTMVDALVDFARSWQPDLVVWETFTLAGAITARVTGAAHCRLVSGPDVSVRARKEFLRLAAEQEPEHREDPTAEWLQRTLRRLGCDAGFGEDLVTGQWTVNTTPPSTQLDLDLPTVQVRHVAYNGPAVVPEWLRSDPGRSRVCVTLGSSASDVGVDMAELLAHLAELDAEIVATVDEATREAAADLPDNVRMVDFVPLNDLLPTCDAVVHHGGVGTKATAELHAVPQLILAFGWDTAVMGRGLEDIGAGLCVPSDGLLPDVLRKQVQRLITEPSFARGARRLQEELLAVPSPNEVVPVLERLVAEHRGGPGARRAAHGANGSVHDRG